MTQVCHISDCAEHFLQVFDFAFPLTHRPLQLQPPPAPASRGEDAGEATWRRWRVRLRQPRVLQGVGSKSQDFSFLRRFQLPLEGFFLITLTFCVFVGFFVFVCFFSSRELEPSL